MSSQYLDPSTSAVTAVRILLFNIDCRTSFCISMKISQEEWACGKIINFTASLNSNSQPWPLSKSKMKCIYIHYIYIILNYKLPNFCLGCYKSNLQSVALSDRWLKLFPIINMFVVKLQILFWQMQGNASLIIQLSLLPVGKLKSP